MANETKLTDEQRKAFIDEFASALGYYYEQQAMDMGVDADEYEKLTGTDIVTEATDWATKNGGKYLQEAIQEAGGEANLAEYIENDFMGGTYDMFETTLMGAAEVYENGDGADAVPSAAAYDLTERQLGFPEGKLYDGIFTDVQDRWLPNFEGQADFNDFFEQKIKYRVYDAFQEIGEDLRLEEEDSIYYANQKDAFTVANLWVGQNVSYIQADIDNYLEQKKQGAY